nr:MAG TPA: SCCmec type IV-encoded binding protein [Caudoviricetes sp.]
MENKKNATSNEKITWNDLETMLATEIVRKAKRETKKWFSAWLLTAALLILSNVIWYLAYNL